MPDLSSRGVFLSYRREDATPHALMLKSELSRRIANARVFMDLDSIAAGLDFAEVIRDAIGSSAVLVALIGRQWVTLLDDDGRRRLDNPDDYVRFEVRTALEHNIQVIPVLVDGAKPLHQHQLPSELQRLVRLNAFDLRNDRYQYDASRLVARIQEVLDEASGTGAVRRPPATADADVPTVTRPPNDHANGTAQHRIVTSSPAGQGRQHMSASTGSRGDRGEEPRGKRRFPIRIALVGIAGVIVASVIGTVIGLKPWSHSSPPPVHNPVGCAGLSYTAPTRVTMAAGTVDCYRLTVAAGDVVRLRVLSETSNSLSGNLEMIDPSGKSVCSDGIGQSALDCTAGPAGTYTIMVSDYDNKFHEPFRIWAQRLNNPVGCAGLSYTAPTRVTMAAGTVDCYRLTVAAGDVVRLRVLSETSNSLSGNLEMIDPSGKSVCSDGIGQSALDCTAGPAGTYTIMVSDYDNKFHEPFRIWAQRLNNPVGCAGLSYTAPTRVTMAAGTVDCYRLTVAAGDVVRLRVLSETSNSLSGNLEMIDPSGKSVCSDGIGQSALDCTAGPAGTYTIMVSDYDNKFHEPFRIWAQRLNNPVGCAGLSYTAPTRVTMAAGTVDCYRLTVAAGDVVRLRVLSETSNSLSGNLEMIDPSGKSVLGNLNRLTSAGVDHLQAAGKRVTGFGQDA